MKKRPKQKTLLAVGAMLDIIIGWYLMVHLLSPWNAVKVVTLEDIQVANPTAKDELRVGCYNIAIGYL